MLGSNCYAKLNINAVVIDQKKGSGESWEYLSVETVIMPDGVKMAG